jgi:glycosyltransferase involved in cell wall biosynthesis
LGQPARDNITVLIPVFNDWKALGWLLSRLDESLQREGFEVDVFVVDDASDYLNYEDFIPDDLTAIKSVEVLELRRNLGHQRAIAVGLAYVEANVDCESVVVMDGDGEDDPDDVPKLIQKCREEEYGKLIFAHRTQRSESLMFKVFYRAYKRLYSILTGYEISVGNFSIIPRRILARIVGVSEIWNHYAVGAIKARIPYTKIPSRRSIRLDGKSQMNFTSLIAHGLSAISVHRDIVGVRLLVATCVLILLAVISIAVAIVIRFTTALAVPGWTTYTVGLFVVILLQAVMLSLFFSFTVLSGRENFSFLPQRDYKYFVLDTRRIFP